MKVAVVASKRVSAMVLMAAVLPLSGGVLRAADAPARDVGKSYHATGNPYLPLWEHVPDSEPRVFEDPDKPGHYRLYITGSHDTRMGSYCGNDNRQWSAPVEDLSSWRNEGPVFAFQSTNAQGVASWDTQYA